MVSDEKSQASDCGSGNTCGVPRLENRETWGTHGFYSAEVYYRSPSYQLDVGHPPEVRAAPGALFPLRRSD
jgi:hypothetical protein